eukprot:TRINITY_DN5540_c0_g2_i3.p1 TRINITY_DN5540_c0_g2~~TRINITY_DN5540_c0_g2_i3.p1  ORF type:complete len:639 (-),score=184.17 TRINITY_DN5540_c0_g2_i3:524-2440(-)
MIRRPPRSTLSSSSAASDVYKRQYYSVHPTPMTGISPTTVPRRGARSNHAGAGRWAVALLVAAASMATLCRAGSLPTDVVVGHTDCVNIDLCNVPGDGSTLQVEAMTANAKTAGNATATFKTQGTKFSGMLTVDCLTTDPWTDGVSLTVEIRDGARVVSGVIPTVITIKGVLSLGSSILVINGTYDFNAVFIALTSFGLEAQSTLVVTGMQFGHTTMPQSVLKSTQPLSIANSSRLELSYTSHTFTSLTLGSAWAWYQLDSASSLDISTDSSVAIIGNSNTLSSVTAPSCSIALINVGGQPMTITEGASLVIDGNSQTLGSVTASTGPLSVTELTQTATTNVTSGGSVQVTGTKVTLLSVTAGGPLTLTPIDTLGLHLDNATVTASRNAYSLSIVTAASLAQTYLRATDINATNGAMVKVEGNSFTRSQLTGTVSPPESSIAFVGSSGSIRVSDAARLHISGNTVTEGSGASTAFTNLRFLVAGVLDQAAGGMVGVDRNSVVFSTTPETLFTLTTDSATINVCLNYVNHLQCTGMPGSGNYSCAPTGADNTTFVLCSKTATITPRTMTKTPITTTTAAPASGSSSTTTAGSSSTTTGSGSSTTSNTTASPGSSAVGAYTSVVGAAVAVVGGCIMMMAL